MKASHLLTTAALTLGSVFAYPADAQSGREIRTERIAFESGAQSAVVKGRISGYEIHDYLLNVQEGQAMNISMATPNRANYFNIMQPGEAYEAIFVGSTNGNQFEGVTAKSGDYRIRVYLMRSAARRKESAEYRLEAIVADIPADAGSAPDDKPFDGPGADARVQGTPYHATGILRCSEAPDTGCIFGVVRSGPGYASVIVTNPAGEALTIHFENGSATGYDSEAEIQADFSVTREGDLSLVRIGPNSYEIPDAVIYGG